MIVVKLMGGLGNQMFQYAFGKCLATLNNTSLKFDRNLLDDFTLKPNFTNRTYELDVFNIQPQFASKVEIRRCCNPSFWDKIRNLFVKQQFVSEGNIEGKVTFNPHYNTYFEGYWQNEDYFLPIVPTIHKDFEFVPSLNAQNLELLKEIKNSPSASIHIRRGDYITNPLNHTIYQVLAKEYYQAAANFLYDKKGLLNYFVFSDDVNWAKTNLKLPGNTIFVTHNRGKESYIDMQLMSNCSHNIIANSSFSWWGAYLNPNKEKMVIAPKKWFIKDPDSSKIIPKSWITL